MKPSNTPVVYIALPVMDENDYLPLLIGSLSTQTLDDYRLVVCVNQPDWWWEDEAKINVCLNNQSVIEYLKSLNDMRITIIDRSSKGNGWSAKAYGIGVARKVTMDYISSVAASNDIIISMDADTVFQPDYLQSVLQILENCPTASALAVPYYHRLTGLKDIDFAILRYEIYMRSYLINLWRINSMYSFTALGSAIAVRVKAYRAINGITPKLSGEDFYFLQKLAKSGLLVHYCNEPVYPAARLSSRVIFGTGPALIKGINGDWNSYPVYHPNLFKDIEQTICSYEKLYFSDIQTPLDNFLLKHFNELPWNTLRQNFKTKERFAHACNEKIDGLRILQYLKENQLSDEKLSAQSLVYLLRLIDNEIDGKINDLDDFDFSSASLQELDSVRNILFSIEMSFREQHYHKIRVNKKLNTVK